MKWLRSIGREIYGLFVDDGSFALALLVWMTIAVVALHFLHIGHWGAPGLLLGLLAILVENTLRASRRLR